MNVRLKRYKKEFNHSYTFGVFPTLELLTHQPRQTIKVLIHPKGVSNQGITKIQTLCQEMSIPTELQERTFERLGARSNDYAVGIFNKTNTKLGKQKNHVVLVNPNSMGNLGTIMRTMLGFGFQDLAIIEPAADHFDPKVVRAAMGAIFKLRISTFPDFEAYRDQQPREYYALMTNADANIATIKYRAPYSLIFGNESSGLSDEFYSLGTAIRIPQTEDIDSFNLAIAVGITLYQFSLAQDR
jgi:RNA methyltransferase, TrmH family